MRKLIAFALLALMLVACSKPTSNAKPLSEKGEKVYAMKGKIMSSNGADNSLRIDHEAIPGFMDAMIMDYYVRGPKVGALPPDNAKVEARLHVADSGYWLTDIKSVK